MANVFVKGAAPTAPDGGTKIAIFEKDDRHPNGELFIGDNLIHEAAPTAAVNTALLEKKLVEASAADYAAQNTRLDEYNKLRNIERINALKEGREPDYSALDNPAAPSAPEEGEEDGDDEAFTQADLDKHSRDELDAIARSVGVDNPDKLPNKQAVIDAILTAE